MYQLWIIDYEIRISKFTCHTPRIYHVSHALHEGVVARRRALHFERYNEEPSRRTKYCSMIV